MNAFPKRRAWLWIAIAAIVIVLVALLVPHGHSTGQPVWLVFLPVFFIGLVVPLDLLPLLYALSLGRTPESPLLASSFQRPPPTQA